MADTGKRHTTEPEKRRLLVLSASQLKDLITASLPDVAETATVWTSSQTYSNCKQWVDHFSTLWKWSDASKQALVEEGGVDAIMEVFDLLQQHYYSVDHVPTMLEFEHMENSILILLTKLSSSENACSRFLERGGLEQIMKLLGVQQQGFGVVHGPPSLTDSAMQCLLGYCSYEACQLTLLETPDVLRQLMKARFKLRNDTLPAKLIFRVSVSLSTHSCLAAPELVNLLLSVIKSSIKSYKESMDAHESQDYWSQKGELSSYHWTSHFLLLALCRVFLLSPLTKVTLSEEHIEGIVQLVKEYLQMCEGLPQTNKISNSLFPLLEAAYAPKVGLHYPPPVMDTVLQFIYYSIEIDLSKSSPEELADEMEYLLCLQWYAPSEGIADQIAKVLELFKRQVDLMNVMERSATRLQIEAPKYRLPSLQTVSRIKLAVGGIGLRNAMKRVREIVELTNTSLI